MEFTIHGFHRAFFQLNGWLQLDELVSPAELEGLTLTPGYDLWRHNPSVRKIVLRRRFADLVSQLIDVHPLRLGYDQYLPANTTPTFSPAIQGTAAGLLLPLESVGSGTVMRPDTPIAKLAVPHLLIVYVQDSSVYRHSPDDHYSTHLRNLGYALGDRLIEPHHPLLCR